MSNNAPPDIAEGEWRILLGADDAALHHALLSVGRDRRDAGASVVLCRPDLPAGQHEGLALAAFTAQLAIAIDQRVVAARAGGASDA